MENTRQIDVPGPFTNLRSRHHGRHFRTGIGAGPRAARPRRLRGLRRAWPRTGRARDAETRPRTASRGYFEERGNLSCRHADCRESGRARRSDQQRLGPGADTAGTSGRHRGRGPGTAPWRPICSDRFGLPRRCWAPWVPPLARVAVRWLSTFPAMPRSRRIHGGAPMARARPRFTILSAVWNAELGARGRSLSLVRSGRHGHAAARSGRAGWGPGDVEAASRLQRGSLPTPSPWHFRAGVGHRLSAQSAGKRGKP